MKTYTAALRTAFPVEQTSAPFERLLEALESDAQGGFSLPQAAKT